MLKTLSIWSLLVSLIAGSIQTAQAQDKTSEPSNNIYVEIGGAGILGSLNYERLILSNRVGLRGGFLYVPIRSDGLLFLPVTASTLLRISNTPVLAEIGAGTTLSVNEQGAIREEDPHTETFATTIIGLRYQAHGGGLFGRIGLVGLMSFRSGETTFPFLGVAIGRYF